MTSCVCVKGLHNPTGFVRIGNHFIGKGTHLGPHTMQEHGDVPPHSFGR
jgi:hypothetical protein